jgi:hypothetical protein
MKTIIIITTIFIFAFIVPKDKYKTAMIVNEYGDTTYALITYNAKDSTLQYFKSKEAVEQYKEKLLFRKDTIKINNKPYIIFFDY